MYTEIELSEFVIRCSLKIADLAYQISEGQRYGREVSHLIEDSTFLRIFTNTINSQYLEWDTKDIYKRVEHVTDRFNLISRPTYSVDLLNKFQPLIPIIKEGGNYINLPNVGEGFVYLTNGEISLFPEKKHTINDLPIA